MDGSDFIELGAGFALGGMMARSMSGALANAMDTRTSMNALTVPQTRAEIQTLLDKLDVRLADGEISEATYKTLTAKWQARLLAIETPTP